MLNFDEFKERFLKEFTDYLPPEYTGVKLETIKVNKINQELTGVVFKPEIERVNFVSPTMYLEWLYDEYRQTGDIEELMRKNSDYIVKAFESTPDYSQITDNFNNLVEENVVFAPVSTKLNKALLKDCPHRKFEDFSIVYRVIVESKGSMISGFMVKNFIAETAGLDEEKLYELARRNTIGKYPFVVYALSEFVMALDEGREPEECDYKNGKCTGNEFYLVRSKANILSASALLYPEFLDEIATGMKSDLYILPSSVYELIVVRNDAESKPEQLINLVREVNKTCVDLAEKLSDNIYSYSRKTRKIKTVRVSNAGMCGK